MPPRWARTRRRIFGRDGWRCRSCGQVVTLHGPGHGVCDHIDRRGGDHDANLQTLCQPCSDAKTQREAAEARRALRAAPPAPAAGLAPGGE